jgi:iron(III) transport system ATP-binding protein
MDFDGSILKATVPNVFLPRPGTPMWLTVRRDRCFVFPGHAGRAAAE